MFRDAVSFAAVERFCVVNTLVANFSRDESTALHEQTTRSNRDLQRQLEDHLPAFAVCVRALFQLAEKLPGMPVELLDVARLTELEDSLRRARSTMQRLEPRMIETLAGTDAEASVVRWDAMLAAYAEASAALVAAVEQAVTKRRELDAVVEGVQLVEPGDPLARDVAEAAMEKYAETFRRLAE